MGGVPPHACSMGIAGDVEVTPGREDVPPSSGDLLRPAVATAASHGAWALRRRSASRRGEWTEAGAATAAVRDRTAGRVAPPPGGRPSRVRLPRSWGPAARRGRAALADHGWRRLA